MRAALALSALTGLAGLVGSTGCTSNEPDDSPETYRVSIFADGDGDGRITTLEGGALSVDLVYQSGLLSVEADGSQEQGGQFTLTNSPIGESEFVGWYGGDCSGIGTCQVLIDGHQAILGVFQSTEPPQEPFTLRVASPGDFYGEGRVTSQPGLTPAIDCTFLENGTAEGTCQRAYPAGTEVTLTVVPAAGSLFRGWLTPGCGTGTSCTMTLTRSLRTAYVLFEPATI